MVELFCWSFLFGKMSAGFNVRMWGDDFRHVIIGGFVGQCRANQLTVKAGGEHRTVGWKLWQKTVVVAGAVAQTCTVWVKE